MPRQNRVTPFGELIATESQGALMGNRGCLHDNLQYIRRALGGGAGGRPPAVPLSELPPGVLVADDEGLPYLVREQRLICWNPGGYGRSMSKPRGTFQVLTPRSIVRAIAQGYPAMVHSSAGTAYETTKPATGSPQPYFVTKPW
jgi:hypothetical protein